MYPVTYPEQQDDESMLKRWHVFRAYRRNRQEFIQLAVNAYLDICIHAQTQPDELECISILEIDLPKSSLYSRIIEKKLWIRKHETVYKHLAFRISRHVIYTAWQDISAHPCP
jgi:hypothetical protein